MDIEQPAESSEIQPKNASWGAIISIVVILAMIVVGAMYAWGKRIDEQRSVPTPTSATSTQNQ